LLKNHNNIHHITTDFSFFVFIVAWDLN